MNFSIQKKIFTEQVQALERVSGKHLNLEVLKCIRVEVTKKEGIRLQATNLDIGIETLISGEVDEPGVVAVPADVLSSFLNNTTGEKVEVSTKGGVLKLKTQKATATIKTIPEEDFPTLPKTTGTKVKISAKKFAQGLRAVWYAAAASSMKPELSSVYVFADDGGIKFVATDSFRLAEKKINIDNSEKLPRMLIPLKNTAEIIRNMETVESEGTLVISEDHISIVFGDTHITSRLIDGTFPDYQQIIPKEHSTEVVILKQDLLEALKTTTPFVNKFNQISILVNSKKKILSIGAVGGDAGESVANIEAAISGEDIEANFNQKYVSDSLQSISEDSVAVRFYGKGKPMVIRGVSDPSFIYLTMPMNR